MVVHIVMFKFKEENKTQNMLHVKELLEALESSIDELNSIEVGVNFSESERAFDLSLYSKFDTKDDLKVYATHPEHLKVLEVIRAVTLESKVVDYNL